MKDKTEDTYRTIARPTEQVLYRDRKSKFYGIAFPINSEEDVKEFLETLRKEHHNATHICYAWQTGLKEPLYRTNDDGEPSHSAGSPILGQIRAFDLTNVLVAVVRYYGGTKLGVGGLINAYRTAARLALENASVVVGTLKTNYWLSFEYPQLDAVMRLLKRYDIPVLHQEMSLSCSLHISVRLQQAEEVREQLASIKAVKVTDEKVRN